MVRSRDGLRLGPGNRSMLLASSVNMPAKSLAAIWAKDKLDGVEWQPLLPQRKKNWRALIHHKGAVGQLPN
jgi:hypothetical protein